MIGSEIDLLCIESVKSSLRDAINGSLISLIGLKEQVTKLPGMTSKSIKARKEIIRTLNKLISEFEFLINFLDDIDSKE
ncbi:hypothetical protein [Larkinella rosea]|uniref:Uncharacterized protein n=1 Tax=Larkinella rosea TaxID=2025312 RepID=A0A3P1BCI8_9BACT|nr:hypothetical protein [Larkinella rosea]RRA98896.1 hypothetical protein EHT25_28320 [Larkinella rosea]